MAARPTRTGSISTIELFTFNDNHNSESTPSFRPTAHPAPWHPKLTLYRLFILVATVGLGAAKAATSYLNLSYASITLEWIMGVVVFIILHLLGSYEEHEGERDTRHLKWMFDIDYLDYLWNVLAIFEIDRPSYRSDEFIDSRSLPRRPPITGYRISVTVLVFFFGFLKSAFGYVNLQTEVTTIECVFGIGVATCLYWLGLYEDSSTKVYPLLFHVDYASTLLDGASTGGILAVAIAKMCLCLVALTACGGVTMAFYSILTLTFNFHWYGAFFPEYPIVPITCGFMINFLFGIMSFSGIIFGLIVLYLLLRILVHLPFIFMRRRVQSAISFVKSMYEKYWLPPTSRQRRNRLFYLKRLLFRQSIKLPMNILVTISVCFILGSFFWLALMFAYVPALMLEPYVRTTLTFPLICFISIPLAILLSSIFVRDFYHGFLKFLSDIRNDYTDEGPALPS